MKPSYLALSGLLLLATQTLAATSDILVRHGPPFGVSGVVLGGAPGNVIFDGQHFVTPSVQTNGIIFLSLIDSNGSGVSQTSLSISGDSPRIAMEGSNHLLMWFDTNAAGAPLVCSRLTNGTVGAVFAIATNAEAETASLRAVSEKFLVVWQSSGADSTILGRWLGTNGSPLADAFAVSPSSAPQRFPSVNLEGTNYLVCWAEQNTASNDWRVMARRLDENGPFGQATTVSQTNLMRPYPTACSFGTNFLVAWSADEGPYDFGPYQGTNLWFAMVYGRVVTLDGNPVSETLSIIRSRGANTNVVVAFGDGRYLVGSALSAAPSPQLHFNLFGVQPLAADGTRVQYGIPSAVVAEMPPRIAFGGGRFCVLYNWNGSIYLDAFIYKPETIEEPVLSISRVPTNGWPYSVSIIRGYRGIIESSTNLRDWSWTWYRPTNGPIFFRAAPILNNWECAENLRALWWAKHQWALDNRSVNSDAVSYLDLVGPGRYLPSGLACPSFGTYSIGAVEDRPTCSVFGHWVN